VLVNQQSWEIIRLFRQLASRKHVYNGFTYRTIETLLR
jgi:hypothetical protein